jgi:diphthamide synthase (EF-2-diphthine--ammonia ligase)
VRAALEGSASMLPKSIFYLSSNLGSVELDEHYERIQRICKECQTLSKTLLEHLYKLKVPAGLEHRKWKSFRHALKGVWSKSELDRMSERLKSLREELDSHMLFLLRYVLSSH